MFLSSNSSHDLIVQRRTAAATQTNSITAVESIFGNIKILPHRKCIVASAQLSPRRRSVIIVHSSPSIPADGIRRKAAIRKDYPSLLTGGRDQYSNGLLRRAHSNVKGRPGTIRSIPDSKGLVSRDQSNPPAAQRYEPVLRRCD